MNLFIPITIYGKLLNTIYVPIAVSPSEGESWIFGQPFFGYTGTGTSIVLAGLQFKLLFDPDALKYLSYYVPAGVSPFLNTSTPGKFAFAAYDLAGLPSDLGNIEFEVRGESALTFADVVASDNQNTEIPVITQNGQVLLEDTNMDVVFRWTNPNALGVVLKFEFFENVDGAGFNLAVGDIPEADSTLTFPVDAGTGVHEFFLKAVGKFGSADSNVLSLNTALPLAPVLSFA